MNFYRVIVNGRVYEGWAGTPANAIFGAVRKDEPNRPNKPGSRWAPETDTGLEVECEWLSFDPARLTAGMKACT